MFFYMKNTIWLGGMCGLFLPMLMQIIVRHTDLLDRFEDHKKVAFLLLAIGANLLWMRYAYKKDSERFGLGLLITTSVCFFYFFVVYRQVLSFF